MYISAKKIQQKQDTKINLSKYRTNEWRENLLLRLAENSNIRKNFITHILSYRKNELYIYVDTIEQGIQPIPKGFVILRKIHTTKTHIDYYLQLLCVKSSERHKGIGQSMIQSIINRLYHSRLHINIYLHSISENVDEFYKKCGFTKCSLDECIKIQQIENIDIGDELFVYRIEPKHPDS